MKIIRTDLQDPLKLSGWEREQVYNGLDCCLTVEILNALLPQLDNFSTRTYAFSCALQGPVLEMGLRGVKIDSARKAEVIDENYNKIDRLERQLDRIVLDGLGTPAFNWRSNNDLQWLFYTKLGIPPVFRGGRPTVDRNALDKIGEYTSAKIFVNHLKAMRDLQVKIKAMRRLGARAMTSYNIAGTVTGRFSSSFNAFGEGGNLQNIEEAIRSIFISDKGKKMAYFDAEQGESRVVGAIEWNLFKDGKYLDACEGGDLHTAVCRLVWNDLGWTGNLERDKKLAERPFHRMHSYRHMAKVLGHGTNYAGQPATMSTETQIPLRTISEFQPAYFTAFPSHREWHEYVRKTLRSDGHLVSLAGRRRWFFGRRNDPATIREAIAYDPQSSLADIVNHGMLSVWKKRDCELLMQGHDAIIIQYPEEREDEVIPRIHKQITYSVELKHGRTLTIPYGCQVGWNWGKWDEEKNPDGLKTYKSNDKRTRTAEVSLMDRKFR